MSIKIKKNISFGTSGHRGIINESFTHEHVIAIAIGIRSLFSETDSPTVVMGCDPRYGNDLTLSPESFTHTLISTLNKLGINTVSYDEFIPTPVISWAIPYYKYDGGMILTASHNPPNYNGIKFNQKNGAPASEAITQQIETKANEYFNNPYTLPETAKGSHTIHSAPWDQFSNHLIQSCTKLGLTIPEKFSKSLSIDIKHGSCGSLWNHLSKKLKLTIQLNHSQPLATFGNIEPNPTKYEHLSNPQANDYASVGNDPDGDRHAVKAENGLVISPEYLTSIIINHLCTYAKKPSALASTVASSQLLKNVCQAHDITYYETAVGFKYFTPYFEQDLSESCLGVESSGGFSTNHHTFEKCGFLPILLLVIICETTKKSIAQLKETIDSTYGHYFFTETEYHYNPEKKETLQQNLKTWTQAELSQELKIPITQIIKKDGLKIITESGWILCRLSGTEPMARIYSEATSAQESSNLNQVFKAFLSKI
jgi:phosphoglucomutase